MEPNPGEWPVSEKSSVETFVVPVGWKRFVLPRRSSAPASPSVKATDVTAAEALLTTFEGEARAAVDNRLTPEDITAAGRAWLSGEPDAPPLGAAAVTQAVVRELQWYRLDEALALLGFWRSRRGLPFAAAAVAELAALYPTAFTTGGAITRSILDRDATGYTTVLAQRMAYRLRRAVVAARPEEYERVVEALAAVRGPSLAQRAVISVMAPDESGWAAEICAEAMARPNLGTIKQMLLTVVDREALATPLAEQVDHFAALRQSEVIHTFVGTLGPEAAPALAGWCDSPRQGDAQDRQKLLGMLAVIGGDQALQALLDRRDQPYVPAALADAAARHPARALRLMAATPDDGRLLANHLAGNRGLAAEVRPLLATEAAARLDEAEAVLTAAETAKAAPGDVPAILRDPAWQSPVERHPIVVDGLTGTGESRVVWAEGERESWADGSWAARNGGSRDWAGIAGQLDKGGNPTWDAIFFFLQGPDELTRPRLGAWRPDYSYDLGDWGPELLGRYEEAAVPALAEAARRTPLVGAPVLAPAATPQVALLMAGWHVRSRPVRRTAAAWFARHTTFAARALVPVAVGKRGNARTDAEAALRVLPREEVLAAAGQHGPEAVAAVEEILAVDPLTVLPKTMPVLPDWANPATLPPVRLTGDRGELPLDAVRNLITMLALSRLDSAYPGVGMVVTECEPADLAGFGWALFETWRAAGHPAKQNWALDALGLLGDDETVRRLAPVIRAWPGEGGHARAVTGLDVLAAIGTDVALMYLNGIARKVKFRGLKERAEEKIAELAAELGLTGDELADRLVPDLGLDADGGMVLDYGRRSFTVGFDEQLKPFVTDATGRRLKALPKPGAQDDAAPATEAYERFAALKKDVRAIAADQVRRLEEAMTAQRRWTGEDFRQFFAGHPLLRHLVRRLVWVRFDAAGAPAGGVRLAEDRSLADVTDETVTLGDDEPIGIAHPVHLGADLAAWAGVFADYEITQPFSQLARGAEPLTSARAAALTGVTVPSTRLLGLERRGWRRGAPQDAGVQGWFQRDVPGGRHLVLEISPGIAVGAVDVLGDQTVTAVFVAPASGYHWRRGDSDDRLSELDPITAAEALRDLTEVLS
ncbi:hypothetical protein GCM10010112_73610 [Actinoplanes lobatus]|uniref:DUF4132 domain-containing protein n=1 Tax=Actinoplanes lobatus TaxID=113568 RepID=A0ABQ4ARL9_9ACTN|nr:hypothetical protein GCM10010112_73610 [Actinoplanes lobatus]GIE43613.1 hypothetical protein Alo02nite_65110 [Actinoplanes lobatus]